MGLVDYYVTYITHQRIKTLCMSKEKCAMSKDSADRALPNLFDVDRSIEFVFFKTLVMQLCDEFPITTLRQCPALARTEITMVGESAEAELFGR